MNEELKNKIQALIREKVEKFTNFIRQQAEELSTLERLRDWEEEDLVNWLTCKNIAQKINEEPFSEVVKANLLSFMEKEVSLIEKSNFLAQQLTKEQLLQEIRKRVDQGEIDLNEIVNFPPHE